MNDVTKETVAATIHVPLLTNIICNGFNMKDTILDVLQKYQELRCLNESNKEEIATDIVEAFIIKMRIKQG